MRKAYFWAFAVIAVATILTGCEKEDKDEISMDEVTKGVQKYTTLTNKVIEYVDLGLPSKLLWATCNVGATSPEQSGLFFSWAEVEPKQRYHYDTYKWIVDGDPFCFTKYCQNKNRGYNQFTDKLAVLEKSDDAAIHYIDSIWQTPSKKNYEELMFYCSQKCCKLNGQWGYLFTSTQSGYTDRSIFIPLSGFIDIDKNSYESRYGYYWINSLSSDDVINASAFVLQHKDDINNTSVKYTDRYRGLPIRAVAKNSDLNKSK